MKKSFNLLYIAIFSLIVYFGFLISNNEALATGLYDLPILEKGSQTWLVDQSKVISLINEKKISDQLSNLAKETGDEVRFVSIRRLDYDLTIDSFADQLFSKWFPTPKDKANQVLIVLDTLSNNSTIRVGQGVKPLLTKEIIQSITDRTIAIPLRQDSKYNEAILDTSYRISQILSGQNDPGAPSQEKINIDGTFTTAEKTDGRSATLWVVVLIFAATAIPMATYFWYVGRN